MVRATQEHHITYASEGVPDKVVYVYKGEHGVLTRIQWWCKGVSSKGFLESLQHYIDENNNEAVILTIDMVKRIPRKQEAVMCKLCGVVRLFRKNQTGLCVSCQYISFRKN